MRDRNKYTKNAPHGDPDLCPEKFTLHPEVGMLWLREFVFVVKYKVVTFRTLK